MASQRPPESPIASRARKTGQYKSPRASFKRIGSPRKLKTTWATLNNTLDDDVGTDKESQELLFSPTYKRDSFSGQDDERFHLNFDDDMAIYHHLRLLTTYRRKIYTGSHKLPPIHDPNKYTLVLDLDETLVHCSTEPQLVSDANFNLEFNGVSFHVAAKFRPFLKEFLESTCQEYELVIFTASQKVYADKVISHFDLDHLITHRLYREDCTNVCGNFIKDLNTLGRDLSKTIFIDNSPQAFAYHIDNSIPILSWYSDANDTELEKLTRILADIRECDDVREYVRDAFGIKELIVNLPDTYP